MKRFICFTAFFIVYALLSNSVLGGDILGAAERGELDSVRALLESDPQLLNVIDQGGYTPLHKAAYNGHVEIVEYLISKGADLNALSNSGSTPLHGAAFHGHPDAVRALIEKGAEIDIKNNGGYTPFLGACAGGRFDAASLLIEHGADINALTADSNSALQNALWNNNQDLVKILVEKGADVDRLNQQGVSPLYFAVAYRDEEISDLLLDMGSRFDITNGYNMTMLHYAAALGRLNQVKILIDKGIDIDARCINGKTVLYYALLWGHDSIAEYLRSKGADEGAGLISKFKGDYLGQKRPGRTPEIFAENGFLTPFAPHGAIVFSPDGNELFWCHQAMPIQAMWYMKREGDVWQQPVIAPFTDPALDYADGRPCFSVDGTRVYYRSLRPPDAGGERKEDLDIWYVGKTSDGYSNPINIGAPINTENNETDPSIANSGNLYFIGSGYENNIGLGDIYVSKFVIGEYTEPENLGAAVNSAHHEISPCISPDESYIIFSSDRPYPGQGLNLFVSFKKKDESWTDAVALGQSIVSGFAWHPFITADGRSIIYQKDDNYCWFSTDVIEDLKGTVLGPERILAPGISFKKSEQDFGDNSTRAVKLADFDSDGDLDAVFSAGQVWFNDGLGNFELKMDNMGYRGHDVDIGDIDNDGDIDIIFACSGNYLYLNDGLGNFQRSEQTFGDSTAGSFYALMVDVNTDGSLDVIINFPGNRISAFLNDSEGELSETDLDIPSRHYCDLDNDGDIDFFVRNRDEGFKVFLNDGSGNLTEYWSLIDTTLDYGFASFADLDNDGDNDAVVTNGGNDDIYPSIIMTNDGTGRFEITDSDLPRARWGNIAFGDINNDGYVDAFAASFTLPNVILLNDGKGNLIDSGLRLGGASKTMISSFGDLDNDGDVDIFASSFDGGSCEVWFNESN